MPIVAGRKGESGSRISQRELKFKRLAFSKWSNFSSRLYYWKYQNRNLFESGEFNHFHIEISLPFSQVLSTLPAKSDRCSLALCILEIHTLLPDPTILSIKIEIYLNQVNLTTFTLKSLCHLVKSYPLYRLKVTAALLLSAFSRYTPFSRPYYEVFKPDRISGSKSIWIRWI